MRPSSVVIFVALTSCSARSNSTLCATGLLNNGSSVCCHRRCGVCAQLGCSKRPGGRADCCPPFIRQHAQVCIARPDHVADDAPCRMPLNQVVKRSTPSHAPRHACPPPRTLSGSTLASSAGHKELVARLRKLPPRCAQSRQVAYSSCCPSTTRKASHDKSPRRHMQSFCSKNEPIDA